jgi:hypothetical protein
MKLTQKHTNQESAMKKSLVTLGVALMSFALVQSALAQVSANHTVTLNVNAVRLLSVSGTPTLTISAGSVGSDDLTTVTENSSTYSLTQNASGVAKVTAALNTALGTGYKLQINAANSTGGVSQGAQDISDGTAKTVLLGLPKGAYSAQAITYTFDAKASSGIFSGTKTMTLTLSDN